MPVLLSGLYKKMWWSLVAAAIVVVFLLIIYVGPLLLVAFADGAFSSEEYFEMIRYLPGLFIVFTVMVFLDLTEKKEKTN